jgi:hypothetical protein
MVFLQIKADFEQVSFCQSLAVYSEVPFAPGPRRAGQWKIGLGP